MTGKDQKDRHLQFSFSRPSSDEPAVPASVLIQTLEGAQRAIWLIAMAREQKDIRSRARIPEEIQRQYQLKCEPPKPGSYLLPTFVDSVQPLLDGIDPVAEVVGRFEAVAGALQSKELKRLAELLPDSGIRRRVVDAFSQLAPKPGSGWRLDLSRNGKTVHMDDNWQSLIRKMYARSETEPDRETVNGELIEINFADRQITILPIGSQRQLRVTYSEEMEDFLLENRRLVIQITGRVSRDEQDELKSIFDLEGIGPLDLSPVEVNQVEFGGVRLRFRQTVRLQPRLNQDNPQFLRVEEPVFGLDSFSGTVSGLIDEVAEDLVVAWKQYALAPDQELSPKALELKRRLLEAVEEMPIAG